MTDKPEPTIYEFPEVEFKTELQGEWLSTIGFNVFTFIKSEDGRAVEYAIPYENIALARRYESSNGAWRAEVYLANGSVRSAFTFEGLGADHFWEWYTK